MATKNKNGPLIFSVWVSDDASTVEIPATSFSQAVQKARDAKRQSRIDLAPKKVFLVGEVP